MAKYLNIMVKELQALIETAETCYAVGNAYQLSINK